MINNEKVYHELYNVTVFFSKAATKLTLDETIHKAQWLISKIEAKIKPGRDLANRTLKRHKKQLANLIKVQKRCEEVFDSTAAAEEWLTSEVIGPGAQTHRELMISDKGIEQVLDELGRDELMLSTKVAELKKSTKRARKSLDQGIRDAQYVLKKVRHNKAVTKLTLNETIRKAQRLISNIQVKIKPGQDSANRTLKRHKKRLAALITVQERCIEVFDNLEKANGWLQSPSIALGWNTPLELLISDKGINLVLNELGRIEHGIVS